MGSLSEMDCCEICCGRNKDLKVCHQHLSTAFYNRKMASSGVHEPECHFCDMKHGIDHMTRNKVILSATSLCGVQYLEGWGWETSPPVHVDMECIPGASITTLRRAWERAYHSNPLPIDTVVVAGLYDVKNLIDNHSSKQQTRSCKFKILNLYYDITHGCYLQACYYSITTSSHVANQSSCCF